MPTNDSITSYHKLVSLTAEPNTGTLQ